MEFFPEMHISREAAEAIARGLYTVAKVDGIHEREAGLIASFWIDSGAGAASLSDLERGEPMKPAELATILHTDDERQIFIKTAVLLTWADGVVTEAERVILSEFAKALGIEPAKLTELEAGVKDYLLKHLAHIQNTDATREVVKKLEV
jgi:tellurite resistance protein